MTAGADEFHVEIHGKGGHGIISSHYFRFSSSRIVPDFMLNVCMPGVVHSDGGMLILASQ